MTKTPQTKMPVRTLRALKKSIERWEENAAAKSHSDANIGWEDLK